MRLCILRSEQGGHSLARSLHRQLHMHNSIPARRYSKVICGREPHSNTWTAFGVCV